MPSNVLLVPGEAPDAADLADRIRDDEWTVLVAHDADQASDLVRSSPASLLLVDAGVWEAPSFRTTIAGRAPSLPVVVLTGGNEPSEVLVKHLKLGAATFIPKSSSKRELRSTIRSIIDLTTRNPYRERVRQFLHAGEVEMRLDNDPANAAVAVGFIQNLMDGYDVGEESTRVRLGIALSEALSNAMIHGNLEVDSALRDGDPDAYFEAIDRRRREHPYADREVVLTARLEKGSITFTIQDAGPGFSVEDVPDPTDPANLLRPSGRGILMMRAYSDSVTWNKRGNEVVLVKHLKPPHAR